MVFTESKAVVTEVWTAARRPAAPLYPGHRPPRPFLSWPAIAGRSRKP